MGRAMDIGDMLRKGRKRFLAVAAVATTGYGIYRVYLWAEPPPFPALRSDQRAARSGVALRLENTPLSGYSNGRKIWTLKSRRVDLERMPGGGISNVQVATLEGIQNGVLFELRGPTGGAARNGSAGTSSRDTRTDLTEVVASEDRAGPPKAAMFEAGQGRYALGDLDPIPTDLALLYSVQWQFRLSHGVKFSSRTGDRLQADGLTMLEMRNRRTNRLERRIVCDTGMDVTHRDVQVHANRVRYDPDGRTVECFGGVRGVFKGGSVQTERLYWSMKSHLLFCPETAGGLYEGTPWTWYGVRIDLERHLLFADRGTARISLQDGKTSRLPLLR